MLKGNKTIQVELIKEYANKQLAKPDFSYDEKMGICIMIEKILQISDNYSGYMFLNDGENKIGTIDYLTRKYF